MSKSFLLESSQSIVLPETNIVDFSAELYTKGLNAQQRKAFSGITSWVMAGTACEDENQAKNPIYLSLAGLFGFAGTGKTFTLQRVAQYLLSKRKKVCFTAPTHKAVQVLKRMSNDLDISVTCMTIHKLLGLSIERNHDGRQVLQSNGSDNSYKYDLIVVDECSMITAQLMGFIPQRTDTKFLFTGDPCQLPPVENEAPNGEETPFTNLSPTFTSIALYWTLTDVVRNSGAVLSYCTDIRNNISQKSLPRKQFARGKFEGLSSNEWHRDLINSFKYGDSQNPDAIRALAWTNNRVQSLNLMIREAIYGANSEPYQVGERLVAKDLVESDFDTCQSKLNPDYEAPDSPYKREDDEKWATGSTSILMYSSAECTVRDANFREVMLNGDYWKLWELEIETDLGDVAIVNIADDSEKEHIKEYFGKWKKNIIALPNQTDAQRKTRKVEWARFYQQMHWIGVTAKGNSFMRQLQYAFALTVHQSQGSTFNQVFSDESNIFGCQDVTVRNQLLYVASSRASEGLFLHCKFMS